MDSDIQSLIPQMCGRTWTGWAQIKARMIDLQPIKALSHYKVKLCRTCLISPHQPSADLPAQLPAIKWPAGKIIYFTDQVILHGEFGPWTSELCQVALVEFQRFEPVISSCSLLVDLTMDPLQVKWPFHKTQKIHSQPLLCPTPRWPVSRSYSQKQSNV